MGLEKEHADKRKKSGKEIRNTEKDFVLHDKHRRATEDSHDAGENFLEGGGYREIDK